MIKGKLNEDGDFNEEDKKEEGNYLEAMKESIQDIVEEKKSGCGGNNKEDEKKKIMSAENMKEHIQDITDENREVERVNDLK